MTLGPGGVEIRRAAPGDLPALIRLCRAHAAYERAPFTDDGQQERLARALFDPPPRLGALVVEAAGALVGYATWSREYSTWRAGEYVHLDCLYLEPAYRGRGLGGSLMARFAAEIAPLAGAHAEWQTPDWNGPAIRFYERLGARGVGKIRFAWQPPDEALAPGWPAVATVRTGDR